MKRLIFIFLSFTLFASAQKESNIWYFGQNAGVDFNSGSPVALTDGQINTLEGCASISDNNGDLLFYTDGMKIYNRNHVVMPNGSGLLGNSSSTQSAIIVKQPSSNSLYYVFTADGVSGLNGGMNYSIVDMSLDGSFGDVNASKNILVVSPTAEKVCAITHQNGYDFWIVTSLENSNTFHSYLLTSSGVNMAAVVNNIGNIYVGTGGYLRSNPVGSKIAGVYPWASGTVEIYDFDNATGILSNNISLTSNNVYYGVEFSPDGNLIYASDHQNSSNITQYNLLAGSTSDIINSAFVLLDSTSSQIGGAMQIAPDGKIYHAYAQAYLGVIEFPNVVGVGCNYDVDGFYLDGMTALFGLPTFVNTYVISPTVISTNYCLGDSTFFSISISSDSILWNFGDILGGENSSNLNSTFHIYSDTGEFTVTLFVYNSGISDTLTALINIISPFVNLGNDTTLCNGEILLIDATYHTSTYFWQDGSVNPIYNVSSDGLYWVELTENSCISIDSFYVYYNPVPNAIISGADSVCDIGDGVYLSINSTGIPPFSITYTNGSFSNTITGFSPLSVLITDTENYTISSVTDNDGCIGTFSGNAVLTINPSPMADFLLNPEETFLDKNEITFTNNSSGQIISDWIFGDGTTLLDNYSTIIHSYSDTGYYTITLVVSNEFGCTDSSSRALVIYPFTYYLPNTFTPNQDGINDLFGLISTKVNTFNMFIVDRWGFEVYNTTDINLLWDGTKNGKPAQDGVYVYKIVIEDPVGEIHEFVGNLFLIR